MRAKRRFILPKRRFIFLKNSNYLTLLPFRETILWYYQLGETLTLCPELIAFGLSARELCGLHENCILSARGYSNLQPYRTKNSEFLLQNRKTFVTLLREFYFFGNENKLYLFPL